MKCRVCKGPAVIDIRHHNANFCADHLQQLCRRQVEKAIADHHMIEPGDRVLVAVSGGKDSLAVWDILLELGYEAVGDLDPRLNTVAHWAEPNRKGVVAYLDDEGRPRGLLMVDVWGKVDAATELIAARRPVTEDVLESLMS